MKNFIDQLVASISSTEYYRGVLFRPFKEIFKFYLLFLLVIALISTVIFWVITKPIYQSVVDQGLSEASTNYPADLVVDWNGEKLQSNQDQLLISFPTNTPKIIRESAEYLGMLSNSELTSPPADILFLITPSQFFAVDNSSISNGLPLANVVGTEPFTITKDTLPTYIVRTKEFSRSIFTVVGIIFPVANFIFLLLTRLYILLIETFIIFLLMKLQRIRLSYKQLFQLNMAIFVPAEIIQLVTQVAQLELPVSMLSLSFWILFIYIFFFIQKRLAR